MIQKVQMIFCLKKNHFDGKNKSLRSNASCEVVTDDTPSFLKQMV
jgi:hypothetical protein